mmetsp:Transcript_3712/g.8126  ORF Transcript_3712/g.8126 Transcript_3712/m.8126 type:complete len:82 (-) Transcript_3712:441-686(-)
MKCEHSRVRCISAWHWLEKHGAQKQAAKHMEAPKEVKVAEVMQKLVTHCQGPSSLQKAGMKGWKGQPNWQELQVQRANIAQ